MNIPALSGKPLPSFTTFSSIAVIIGIVVGIGIFRLPSMVALNSEHELHFLLFWIAGGFVSLMGALCYAELSSRMPNAGGEYHFLSLAFGPAVGFFLSWGRMSVIQTGSIALVAYILGDYATVVLDLGTYSSSIYAAGMVIALTMVNILGTDHSRRTQGFLSTIIVGSLVAISIAGLFLSSDVNLSGSLLTGENRFLFTESLAGPAMIFVLLTYGGWNEAAYLSGELHDVKRSIVKALVSGIAVITALYVLVNLSYLHVLGFEALKDSEAIGYDLTEKIFGPGFSIIIVIIVIVAALSTANATIITGARTNYALGRDFRLLRFMGTWSERRNTPTNAHLFQGAIALALVIAGAWSQQAISTIVDYTAPVFWFFLLLITLSLFIFRYRESHPHNAFSVPLYPLPPLIFLATCIYMLYSSLAFTGTGAIAGASILLAGVPVYFFARKYQNNSDSR